MRNQNESQKQGNDINRMKHSKIKKDDNNIKNIPERNNIKPQHKKTLKSEINREESK